MLVPLYARDIAAVAGGLLVLSVWSSAIGALVVTRAVGSRLTRMADKCVTIVFRMVSEHEVDYRGRDRILSAQAAAILFAQLGVWEKIKYRSRMPSPNLTISVMARQWEWRMRYPSSEHLKEWADPAAAKKDFRMKLPPRPEPLQLDRFAARPQVDDRAAGNPHCDSHGRTDMSVYCRRPLPGPTARRRDLLRATHCASWQLLLRAAPEDCLCK